MPLRLTRAADNETLWRACAGRFLDELGEATGPDAYPSHLWIAHRNQRDALLGLADERRLPGWLAPPFSFLSSMRELFRIEARPLGILTGRLLVARTARATAARLKIDVAQPDEGPARAHMLDGVFSELLPERVPPETLRDKLAELPGDEFARRRNSWVADTYEAFRSRLEERGLYDPREIHALVAQRIEAGELRLALRGASRLHIYGITSLRGRRRLFGALATQDEVDVTVYLPAEAEPSEWDDLADESETLEPRATGDDGLRVQPAPDAIRETAWVAREVKRLIAIEGVSPDRIAVIARSGRRDTRLVHRALRSAGVPATARLRSALAEIPALKALLALFQAAAVDWSYRDLRPVLTSPYFRLRVDSRPIDWIARRRRPLGLEGWLEALGDVRDRFDGQNDWRLHREGLYDDAVDRVISRVESFRDRVAPLAERRTERGWIDLTLEILQDWFDLRDHLCDPVAGRWDIVRLDQRGTLAVEGLLAEWRTHLGWLADRAELRVPEFDLAEWHRRIRKLLEANEIANSTPLQAGVQVLEAHQAALTPFDHAFVVHANDGEFPRPASGTGIFTDRERGELRDLGLPISDREDGLRRERTLWRSVVGSGSVTISYRTTDAGGTPRLPSLLVPRHDVTTELPRTLDESAAEDGAGTDTAIRPSDFRRQEILRLRRQRRAGSSEPFVASDPWRLRHAVLSAFADELRSGGLDGFLRSPLDLTHDTGTAQPDAASLFGLERAISEQPHPWNGWIRDPVVRAALEQRFGDDHVWSASQLQQYAVRPFDFLLDRVLRLREIEEADEETSPLAFGGVAHEVLERFYRDIGESPPPTFDELARERLGAACDSVFEEREASLDQWLGVPILWSVTREEMRDALEELIAVELRHLAKQGWRPLLVEEAFGSGDDPPVLIEGPDHRGQPGRLRLRGRIDRVDARGDGDAERLKVIDYKTGAPPSKAGHTDGALLQSGLYMRAVEQLGHGTVEKGVFRSIRRRTMDGAELRPGAELDGVISFALTIPHRVRSGFFEAVQARTVSIANWQPGRELTRSDAAVSSMSRFDPFVGEVTGA